MAELGTFALRLAIIIAVYAVLVDLVGWLRRDRRLIQRARNATLAYWLCLSVAIAALLIGLARCDFSIKYVAAHTSKALPLAYRLSALWAGAAGSLLLWLWLQVGMTVLAFSKASENEKNFVAQARIAANIVGCFFLVVLLFDKNAFAVLPAPPGDGAGLNPLLQHPAMVLHPPTLFIGYAAYVIPFCWALASLAGPYRQMRPPFFLKARKWMLIAWLFLTIGNALGSWWAYEELGWGGFWAWDPVENSSLMPWLTGTALLHSFKRFRVGGAVGCWVIFLCLLTYSLCIFGTFLTRYGLVSSVHAFGEAGLGILFLVLLGLVWFAVVILAIMRLPSIGELKPTKTVKGDGIIVLVNWLFIILVAVIFLGTLFPFFSGLFSSEKITLQPEYFSKITAPAGLLLLLFMGVCPHFFRYGPDRSWRSLGGIVTAMAAVILWFITEAVAIPCFFICGYAALNMLVDFCVRRKSDAGQTDKPQTHHTLSWYGARWAHIGVVMMFVGIAGAEGYSQEQQILLKAGQSRRIAGHRITFEKIDRQQGPNFLLTAAEISVEKKGEIVYMKPALSVYENKKQTSEVDIDRTLAGDLYVSLTAVGHGGQIIMLRVLVRPLINWLWLGSAVMVAGAIMVLISWHRNRRLVQPGFPN